MRVSFGHLLTGAVVLCASIAYAGEVSGPYARKLSAADVAQIKSAISKQPHVAHNVKKIEAVRPDIVAVTTTSRTGVTEDTSYDFNLYKRSGVWRIDENSIQISMEYRDFRTNGPTIIR